MKEKEMSILSNTEYFEKGYILSPITLGKELSKLNREVTKTLAAANERIKTIPNPTILFNQIILIESKATSAIENIITTDDELYKEVINESPNNNAASKTLRIRSAVKYISKLIEENKIIRVQDILQIGKTVNGHDTGFRPGPGTTLKNASTGEVVHTPPQSYDEVMEHITPLVRYINEGGENDPITDALLVHHAFEWIHPFIDGNGRVGRILIAAYLMLHEEISNIFLPISYFINLNRDKYYKILAAMTNSQDYEEYLKEMFKFIIDASEFTLKFTRKYDENRKRVSKMLMQKFNKYYDDKIIDSLFYNAYTTPKHLEEGMELNYRTVIKIMNFLEEEGIFSSKKEGKRVYYINNLISKEVQNG